MATDYNDIYGGGIPDPAAVIPIPQDSTVGDGGSSTDPAPAAPAAATGTPYNATTPGFGTKLWMVLVMTLAACLRHVQRPNLWIPFLPGRYAAFIACTCGQESVWGTVYAESATGGGKGLLYFNDENAGKYEVTRNSLWSEGYAVPAYLSDTMGGVKGFLYYLIPGPHYLRMVWRSFSAMTDSASFSSADKKVDAEKGIVSAYWMWRVPMVVLDIPLLFVIALASAWSMRWAFRAFRGKR